MGQCPSIFERGGWRVVSLLGRKQIRRRYVYALFFFDSRLPPWTVYVGCTGDLGARQRQHAAAWPWPFLMAVLWAGTATAQKAEEWESAYQWSAMQARCRLIMSGKSGPRFGVHGPRYTPLGPVPWPAPPLVPQVSHSSFYTVDGESTDDRDDRSRLFRLIVALPGVDVTHAPGLTPIDNAQLKNLV